MGTFRESFARSCMVTLAVAPIALVIGMAFGVIAHLQGAPRWGAFSVGALAGLIELNSGWLHGMRQP